MLMNKQTEKSIPLPVIELAAGGDVDALNAVLKHYEGYIAVLATRRLFDDFGNPHFFVDAELQRRLETKLITAILAFKAA
jgi:hypothetical protein